MRASSRSAAYARQLGVATLAASAYVLRSGGLLQLQRHASVSLSPRRTSSFTVVAGRRSGRMISWNALMLAHRLAVHVDDQVVRLEPRLGRRRAGHHFLDVGRRPLDDVGHEHDAVVAALPRLRSVPSTIGLYFSFFCDEVERC